MHLLAHLDNKKSGQWTVGEKGTLDAVSRKTNGKAVMLTMIDGTGDRSTDKARMLSCDRRQCN